MTPRWTNTARATRAPDGVRRREHSFEKTGHHLQPKAKKGHSDVKAAGGRDTNAKTAGGVDATGGSGLTTWTTRTGYPTPAAGR